MFRMRQPGDVRAVGRPTGVVPRQAENAPRDELAQINFAQPRIVASRRDFPSAVRKQTDARHEHRPQMPFQRADIVAVRPVLGEDVAPAAKIRKNESLDRRDDFRIVAALEHRRDIAFRFRAGDDRAGAPARL
mgnify:CR=1 FL=1